MLNASPLVIDDMIKVVSLLENPPESGPVWEALKCYNPPQFSRTQWGNVLPWLAHYECPQDPWELSQMLQFVKGKNSLLEVGSSFGGTLKRMAAVLAPGSRIVSVDLACDETPVFLNPVASLRKNAQFIAQKMEHDVHLILADSHAAETIDKVMKLGPFDFGFIDGDHSYEGVTADWENYGPMCRTIAFHDIAAGPVGCITFWNELKASGRKTVELIHDTRRFGIGIVPGD